MLEATLTGHVGSVKFVAPQGKQQVLNLNIACNRRVGEKEYTDWVSAKLWGDRAAKLKDHVTKGARLLLKGRPEARAYQKGDGTPGAELILHVSELEFLSSKAKGAEEPELATA
jgi:single-stranded DNA-binding protein